jgi:hypothetical protein
LGTVQRARSPETLAMFPNRRIARDRVHDFVFKRHCKGNVTPHNTAEYDYIKWCKEYPLTAKLVLSVVASADATVRLAGRRPAVPCSNGREAVCCACADRLPRQISNWGFINFQLYDFPHCRRALHQPAIQPRIARRGIGSSQRLGRHRRVIERTLAWFSRFRRLTISYKRRADIFEALHHPAASLICRRFLQRRFCYIG